MTVCSANAAPLRAVDITPCSAFHRPSPKRQQLGLRLLAHGFSPLTTTIWSAATANGTDAWRCLVPPPFGQSTWKQFGFDADFRFRSICQ